MKDRNFFCYRISNLIIGAIFLFSLASCTHEDTIDVNIQPPSYNYGTSQIDTSGGWTFNKSHSNVMWETPYLGVGATLTGRFNSFVAEINFDEDNPENTSFVGKVTLSSVNTGEPGRDGGCLLTTFGTEVSDEAVLASKSVVKDGKGGYNVVADLSFHGFVKEVQMKLTYTGITFFDVDSGLNGTPFSLAGFTAEFEFNAISDFGIASANIADKVLVRINAQFKKAG